MVATEGVPGGGFKNDQEGALSKLRQTFTTGIGGTGKKMIWFVYN